ncbi:response regulator [bacterium]|nr:response regulator [bacterium]
MTHSMDAGPAQAAEVHAAAPAALGQIASIPSAPIPPAVHSSLRPAAPAAGRSIMIADDDRVVRYVVGQMLSRLGYQVECAEDGYKARELFEAGPDSFGLVIIDLTMPGMNGSELISHLRELRPGQQILVTTGHTDSEQVQELLKSGGIEILTKPFNFEDLQAWISQRLG